MVKVAFIGLGNMGGPMAGNLVAHGHDVRGFDLSAEMLQAAGKRGVTLAKNSQDAVSHAEIVITMLPAGTHVLAAYTDLLPAVGPGTLFIDCSTIDVASARKAHSMVLGAGTSGLDAPVSGGTGGAEAGTLTFMVGGTAADFASAQPVLGHMGRKSVHCGAGGAGQAAKICNNMILGVSMIAVSEAFVLAEKLGLSHQALFDVASASSGQCWSMNTYCPVPGPVPASPANTGYKAGFSTALMLKDLRLAQQAAMEGGADTALGRHAAEIFGALQEAGHGNDDFSTIINAIRDRSHGKVQ